MTVTYHIRRIKSIGVATLWSGSARAHASEQGFVLLLPTDVYITAGVAVVALTVLMLLWLPDRWLLGLWQPVRTLRCRRGALPLVTSCLSFLLLAWLIHTGLTGPRDPLANPLVLFIWTIWWIAFIALQGLLGNLWLWVDPWRGPLAVVRRVTGWGGQIHLPYRVAPWIAVVGYLGLMGFVLADIAPSDPDRLARVVGGYWLIVFAASLIFGPRFLDRAETVNLLMRSFARMGIVGRERGRLALGLPGWQAAAMPAPQMGVAVLMIVLLGSGSFDGLNETFWWLMRLGINPLEFPGRSAVVIPTLAGLLAANLALIAVFAVALRIGVALSGLRLPLARVFRAFAPSLMPIALGYHVAHYLPNFLVDGQYALIAASDPFATGADLLGFGTYYVTTGFFNTAETVRMIWLSQAAAVVIGHVLAVLLAHAIALREFGTAARALRSQIPMACFMMLYTFFGLWLLAAPRGG